MARRLDQVSEVRDRQDYVVARVTRHRVTSEELDYVAISCDDQLITVSVEDVPQLMRALLRALNEEVRS